MAVVAMVVRVAALPCTMTRATMGANTTLRVALEWSRKGEQLALSSPSPLTTDKRKLSIYNLPDKGVSSELYYICAKNIIA